MPSLLPAKYKALGSALAGEPEKSWWEYPLDILDYLNRPLYSVSGAITALQEGKPEELASRMWEGFTGKEKRTWDDILGNLGMEPGWGRTITAIPLDISTEFALFGQLGALTKLGKMARTVGRAGPLTTTQVSKQTTRLRNLGKALLEGVDITSKRDLRTLRGPGKQAALALARGEKILPLAETLAGQGILGQRSLLSLLGGRLPVVKGVPIFKGLTKTGKYLKGTWLGKHVLPIFKRTTGNKYLDQAMDLPGGIRDTQRFLDGLGTKAKADYLDIMAPVLKELRDSPEDLASFQKFVRQMAEPGKLEAAGELFTAGVAAQPYAKLPRLPIQLKHLQDRGEKAAEYVRDMWQLLAVEEARGGLTYATKVNYMPHIFSPDGRAAWNNTFGAGADAAKKVNVRGFHGSMMEQVLTSIGNVDQVNALAKTGYFGDAVAAVPKLLEDDLYKLLGVRFRMAADAISNRQMVESLGILSRGGKLVSPGDYANFRKAHPDAMVLVHHPQRGLLTPREFTTKLAPDIEPVISGTPRYKTVPPTFEKEVDKLATRIFGKETRAVEAGAIADMKRAKAKLLFLDPDLAKAALSHRKPLQDPSAMEEATKGILAAYDKAHSILRRYTLGIFPSWMMRNVIGNYSAMWYMGMKPWDMTSYTVKAGKLQHLLAKNFDDWIELGGRRVRASRVGDMLMRLGVKETGWHAADIEDIAGAGIRKLKSFDPAKLGFKANRWFENNARIAGWMWSVDQGMDFMEGARNAKKFFFDYTALSDVERKFFKRTCFFYTWLRKNLAIQTETLLTNPFKITPLSVAQIEMMKRTGIDKSELPEWAQEAVPVPWGRKGSKVTFGTLASWIPAGDLIEMLRDPKRKLFGAVTPMIGRPLEAGVFNWSVFRERPIEEYPTQTVPLLGARVPAKVGYVAEAFRPVSTLQRFVSAPEVSGLGTLGELGRFVHGVRAYTADLGKEKAKKEAQRRGHVAKLRRWHRYYSRRGSEWDDKVADIERVLEMLGSEVPTY